MVWKKNWHPVLRARVDSDALHRSLDYRNCGCGILCARVVLQQWHDQHTTEVLMADLTICSLKDYTEADVTINLPEKVISMRQMSKQVDALTAQNEQEKVGAVATALLGASAIAAKSPVVTRRFWFFGRRS